MHNILNLIKSKGSCIEDFKEDDVGSFELITQYTKYAQRTWLKYELSEDGEIVRMELAHLFGNLDFSQGSSIEQLLLLLSKNIPSFEGSSAFLGIKQIQGTFFAFLNAAPIFSVKSSDNDIAEGLWTQIFDVIMSLMFEPPPPIKQFGAE